MAGFAYPNPANGAVALPTGYKCDFNSFGINETVAAESVLAYGTNIYDPWRSSGTPHQEISASGFARYGSSGETPGFGMVSPGGGASTFTVDTGVTLAGNYVITDIRLGHSRSRAAVPLSYTGHNSGDITTTWPTS
jgi:hypothetical protein